MAIRFETLTALQVALVDTVYRTAGNCPTSYLSMVADNFSWFLPIEVAKATGWSDSQTGGVLSGALSAGIVGTDGDGEFWVETETWQAFADAVEAGLHQQASHTG